MKRSTFLRQAGLSVAAISLNPADALRPRPEPAKNPLPRWKGFNVLDFFSPNPSGSRPRTTQEHFKWMQDWGFDFIRVPIAYPYYLDFDRTRDIRPDEVYHINERAADEIEELVRTAHRYNLHVSLNLHRAPGYCINAGFHEPFNLWKDAAAQQAFFFHWNYWAKRFKQVSRERISFDLVNEPSLREDMNDQHSRSGPVPGPIYRQVAEGALKAIRQENSHHLVIADGNNVGNSVIEEIRDLDIAQSCRGYNPGAISHYRAPWANKDPDHMSVPKWPGQVGNQYLGREMLEAYYKPWIQLAGAGTGVHCGECGCWNKTPHGVFLAWFADVLSILSAGGIGFALWNFMGDFGVLDSGRPDVDYEDWFGHKLDRRLLNLLQKS
ncbi:MAG TPA: cellulase family glycosylhydrolase [Chitinophagaceae bacterium]|nr:cellulase family glycosylhydrolase [Chitinophagaceae bacterium]